MEKPSHLKFVLRTFSDDEITELLEAGGNFRDLMPAWRDNILSQMRAGRWDTGNGECLSIDEEGGLANGQHRLSAAQIYQREAGVKVWFWVATGVRKGCDKSMDQGMSRTLTTMLRKEGVVNASECASIAIADTKMVASGKGANVGAMLHGKLGKVCVPASYESWKRSSAVISEWAAMPSSLRTPACRAAPYWRASAFNSPRSMRWTPSCSSPTSRTVPAWRMATRSWFFGPGCWRTVAARPPRCRRSPWPR